MNDDENRSGVAEATFALTRSECRWPIGDATSPDFRFCGEPITTDRLGRHVPGNKYCEAHTKEAYVSASRRPRKARRV